MKQESRNALERKQREALFEQREQLWALAQRGYRATGRGLVVVDGRNLGHRGEVPVSWRPGAVLLGCTADAQEWVRRSAECLRSYDPERELVLQYWSPSNRMHLYRVRVRPQAPGARPALAAAAAPNTKGCEPPAVPRASNHPGAKRSWTERW
jgi:hypothetical protein